MIQDVWPYQIDNCYAATEPDAESYLIFLKEDCLLLQCGRHLMSLPQYGDISAQELELTYLFSAGNHTFYMADGWEPKDDLTAPSAPLNRLYAEGYQFHPVTLFQSVSPKWLCFAGITAYQLGAWYRDNRFCGRCGNRLRKDDAERKLSCSVCSNAIYPKISPAVIVGVTDHDRLLVTEYADRPRGGRYALIAGFVEIGETIEETVRREVMEETGVRVKNLRYYKSQPWPFSDALMLGFFCELDGSDAITMNGQELSVAKWVAKAELPPERDGISLTSEMMNIFKNGG